MINMLAARLPWHRTPGRANVAADSGGGSARYRAFAALAPAAALARLAVGESGLGEDEAARRLQQTGPNAVAADERQNILLQLLMRLAAPLNILLLALALVSFLLGDARAALMIAIIVCLSVGLSFVQEYRSNQAAAKLRAMVRTTATVLRADGRCEIPIALLVPGDLVILAAGDMVPADLRLVAAKHLFVNQAALTGEAMPAEKRAEASGQPAADPLAQDNLCFMGTNVVSGAATGLVLFTGPRTVFGQVAGSIARRRPPTEFEMGIDRFVGLMLRFMLVMVPAVFLINGFSRGDWFEALLFAVAVAVGLTPEMLPMIVSMNLAKGSLDMARKKVIVKRLAAIQNLGAMDVLCTDKTGTLTQDRIILKRHLDIKGADCDKVLEYAYLNSTYQSGLKNLLDVAILKHTELHRELCVERDFKKIDELPFDFERRRMSVVLQQADGTHLLICKGAVEEMFAVCREYELGGERGPLDASHFETAKAETALLNEDGFRVVAVGYRIFQTPLAAYGAAEEQDLVLLGYVAFLDPPKDTAAAAIASLARDGVAVKILTGDNEIVTRKICREVGLPAERVLLGSDIETLSPEALDRAAESATVFAKLSPIQKAMVIEALHRKGHVVGFLGDGINDGPALRAADVGLSVEGAVDIARECADLILLEKSLTILHEGVAEGRRVFGNIVKYLKMGASSNFGNMLSLVGASLFLPFLPMAPVQILANNLLYDSSQTAIPTDNVDADYARIPRRWDLGLVLKFMLCMGPVSSLFDYATFFVLLVLFGAWNDPALFQTGWFVESLLTQTIVIHIIRTAGIPFLESRPSLQLTAGTLIVGSIAVLLPGTEIGHALGFAPLPGLYWPALAVILIAYMLLAQLVKGWFVRRFGIG